ncbi:hypothetical protein O7606_13025 [Micromonospora sp. WMMD882]|uniref:hypothetical protein n=1 Tax=Micromonospora sp. WMMD882 TaxID=3015151 RepID=UPI00248B829B|nr:hypothetical protein [Micromonospora sp. WMMD882]WBB82201.1 hypothetical protein O7606_13025 [Micromonospora sp. WMMD882]
MATPIEDLADLLAGRAVRPGRFRRPVGERPGAPEASLLVWMASRLARLDSAGADSVRMVRLAAMLAGDTRATDNPWPVIPEAMTELLGARPGEPPPFRPIVPSYPPEHPFWAAPLGWLHVPDVAYLLPELPPAVVGRAAGRVLDLVEEAAYRGADWYATAVAARVAPFLDPTDRDRLRDRDRLLHPFWRPTYRAVSTRATRWPTVAAELLAAHPAVPLLDRLADSAPVADLVRVIDDAVISISVRLTPPIRSSPDEETGAAAGALPPDDDLPDRDDPWGSLPGGGRPDDVAPSPRSYDLHPQMRTLGEGEELVRSYGAFRGPRSRPAGAARPPARTRYVSTGVARPAEPDRPIGVLEPLSPRTAYLFWLEVGEPAPGAFESAPAPLTMPAGAGPGTALTVAVFGYPAEIAPVPGADVGELVVAADGALVVRRQPDGRSTGGARLYFPIRTPNRPGRHRLRCGIYCRGTLLQSRMVSLVVGAAGPHGAVVDYAVDTRLDPRELSRLADLDLSIFVNDNGPGTHGFRFLGAGGEIKQDTALDAQALQDLVTTARRTLRRISWGSDDEYRRGLTFRYDRTPPDPTEDLIDLACTGYALWTAIAGELAGPTAQPGVSPLRLLRDRLRRPGVVELASRASARMVVPAALFYDHPLDQGLRLTLCPTAGAALRAGVDLTREPCFQGECPSYGDRSVVCPAGFWGFRHELGLPRSALSAHPARGKPHDVGSGGHLIRCGGRPRCVVGISQEFAGPHPSWVRGLGSPESQLHADREGMLAALRAAEPVTQLVYFFCHGAIVDGEPLLLVGPPEASGISYLQIADGDVYWPEGRPLVFLNGCRTAAVEPRYAMSFVDAFVTRALASGVIGTEIVTYESLAETFGRLVLDAFVNRRESIGRAVRSARLALLAAGNPLGLIYVAYAPPNLRLDGPVGVSPGPAG